MCEYGILLNSKVNRRLWSHLGSVGKPLEVKVSIVDIILKSQ